MQYLPVVLGSYKTVMKKTNMSTEDFTQHGNISSTVGGSNVPRKVKKMFQQRQERETLDDVNQGNPVFGRNPECKFHFVL